MITTTTARTKNVMATALTANLNPPRTTRRTATTMATIPARSCLLKEATRSEVAKCMATKLAAGAEPDNAFAHPSRPVLAFGARARAQVDVLAMA